MSAASTASRTRCSRSRPSSRPSTRRSWRRRRGRRSWPCAAETWRSSSGDGPSSRARSAPCGKAAADLGERRRVLRVWGSPGRSVMSEIDVSKLNETVREESLQVQAAIEEVKKVIVGQKALIDRMMVALLCRGHLLVEGVPGLAKTLAVKTLGQVLDLHFARIQFTPDLLPADLIGTMIYQQKTPAVARLLKHDQVLRRGRGVREIYMDDRLRDYMVALVLATRKPKEVGLVDLAPLIAFGASPRATLAFSEASRAVAFLRGRGYVVPEDVKEIAKEVLRHRILLTYEAEAENVTTDTVVERILDRVEVPCHP